MQTLAREYMTHATRVSRAKVRESPLNLRLKTRVKARSKVLRFLQVAFEQHPMKLSSL